MLRAYFAPPLGPMPHGRGCRRVIPPRRAAIGLDALDFHGVGRSYVTHLIEAGRDPLFVQFQRGHEHANTTSLYTCVSSGFRPRTVRRALDETLAATMGPEG